MWDGLYPQETEQALTFRANNPQPPEAKKPSIWAQAGEIAAAPFKGIGQAGMQTGRNANAVTPLQVGNPLAMSPQEQEDMLTAGNITREGQDAALRQGVDALKPDPMTSTTASMILQDGARILTKVGMYSAAGGFAGAVAGTGVDEGLTGFMEMRDQGVDASTAAKVGAVRGVSTAVGVALPAVGKTALQTVGLVAAGGPGSFMAEQAVTRAILEQANYPDLAREHDPTDLVGLGVSIAVPGVVGTALHRAKVKNAKAAAPPATEAPSEGAILAATEDMRDAAHVAYANQVIEANNLGDRTDPQARNTHMQAIDAATQAMNEGQPFTVPDMLVNPAKMERLTAEVTNRMRQAEAEAVKPAEPGMSILASGEVPIIKRPISRHADQLSFNLAPIIEDATRLLGTGRAVGDVMNELQANGVSVSPEVHNMMAGLQEFQNRMPELMQEISAVDWKSSGNGTGNGKPHEVIADAIERLRGGSPTIPADSVTGRAMKVVREMPDLPVRMDDDGSPAKAAREVLRDVRHERTQAKTDANAYVAAAECFLKGAE